MLIVKLLKNIFNRADASLLLFGITGMCFFASLYVVDIYKSFNGDAHIWWTNSKMKLSMEDVSDKVEIYLGDELLQKKIANKALLTVDKDGAYRLVSVGDLKFRINNWTAVKVIKLQAASITGIFVGVSLALFAVGIAQIVRNKKKGDDINEQE